MVAYQNQARRAEAQYIADNRAREEQKRRDFETSRQRQREQNLWAEHAAYVKRVTTPPKASKPEPRILVPSRAATIFVPDESQQDANSKEPARCFSASAEDFLARMLRFAFTGTMWAFAAVVVMPWLYASAFNRALIGLGVGFGLSANLVVWVTLRHRASRAVPSRETDRAGHGGLHGGGAGPPRRHAGSWIWRAIQEEIVLTRAAANAAARFLVSGIKTARIAQALRARADSNSRD
jgi:hypothetical protein